MNFGKETETLEFKKSTGEMKEAMISISSILNKHGIGTLYFGIKPNGDIVGPDVSESSLRDVSRAVYENIRPQIYPDGFHNCFGAEEQIRRGGSQRCKVFERANSL